MKRLLGLAMAAILVAGATGSALVAAERAEGKEASEQRKGDQADASASQSLRQVLERLEQMEKELRSLREENKRLRDELAEQRAAGEKAWADRETGEEAERGDKEVREKTGRAEKEARDRVSRGEARGSFVRLGEGEMGGKRYRTVEVRVGERGETVSYYMGPPRGQRLNDRQGELHGRAERLKAGQKVEIGWVKEGGDKVPWVTAIGAEGLAEGDRERDVRREGDREGADRERDVRREGADRERDVRREGDREGADRERDVRREGDREGADRERDVPREGGDRERKTDEQKADAKREAAEGEQTRGTFVRLQEKKVGDIEYLALLVRPDGRDATETLLVPMHRTDDGWARDKELTARARKLKEGQRVEITWRQAEGQRFIKRIEW